MGKPAGEVLEKTGWARSVGCVGPYLTLFSRASAGRQDTDDAVARMEIHELPSARGCTYVVPASDFALALKVGQDFSDEGRTARKLGVTDAELDKLSSAVLDALSSRPMEPEELHSACGGTVRNLGDAGKKKGLVTTLPVALGGLQAAGQIRRIPTNGRLDQQRYRYGLWEKSPLGRFKLSAEEAFIELARRFFTWAGPATLAEFQWFSGLGVKTAKAAVAPLGLDPLEDTDERLLLPQDHKEFRAFKVPKKSQYVLVSSLDGISHLRRDVEGLLAPEDMSRSVFCENGLMDLSSHAILDRGRIVGLWEYDIAEQSIVWMSFIPKNRNLEEAVARTESFIRSDLGDARSFSLDSPKSRVPRIEALKSASGNDFTNIQAITKKPGRRRI